MEFIIQESTAHPWVLWATTALIFLILEVALPSFTFAFLSVAALAAMLASFVAGWLIQIIVFAVALGVSVPLVRPLLLARLRHNPRHKMPSRSQALMGAHGEVIEKIDPATGTGRVLVNGQDWAARSQQELIVGHKIIVDGHDGIVLLVKEI